jgi:hypothetical protein
MASLLVIVPDRPSVIVKKGEYTPRYYNPGNLFDEVHLLLTNDDRPEVSALQETVGRAQLSIHNLPASSFVLMLGWQPFLLRGWVKRGLDLVKTISPHLVRTHNNFIEGYLAKEIKDAFGIPYVISLHGVWDRDIMMGKKNKIIKLFIDKLERISLKNADSVIAVYKSILRYAISYGAKNVELIYNIVAGENIECKTHYKLANSPRLITINRQLKEKNPDNIIRAIKDIDC